MIDYANQKVGPSGHAARPANQKVGPSGHAARPANQKVGPSGRPINRYRRFLGYDYSRGASLFITIALDRRFHAFGSVVGDHVAHSSAGIALEETILSESPGIPFLRFVPWW